MDLTILTPVYNRKQEIRKLWESLQNQTNMRFEWMIVDDGSTDGLKESIDSFIYKSDFQIKYIRKENGGKHTALNVGINATDSDLIFIVDSDDWITEDAIDTILEIHNKYRSYDNLCGYAFLRAFPDGKINGKCFSKDGEIASYIDVRVNGDDTHADKAEIFLTKCLKEFPFPEYPGEKFLGEDIVWVRMARKYNMVHINKAIYIGNYMDDGLTQNRRKNNIMSPLGCMYRTEEFLEADIKFKYRIKAAIQYVVYGRFAKRRYKELINNSNHKAMIVVFLLPGIVIQRKWEKEIK